MPRTRGPERASGASGHRRLIAGVVATGIAQQAEDFAAVGRGGRLATARPRHRCRRPCRRAGCCASGLLQDQRAAGVVGELQVVEDQEGGALAVAQAQAAHAFAGRGRCAPAPRSVRPRPCGSCARSPPRVATAAPAGSRWRSVPAADATVPRHSAVGAHAQAPHHQHASSPALTSQGQQPRRPTRFPARSPWSGAAMLRAILAGQPKCSATQPSQAVAAVSEKHITANQSSVLTTARRSVGREQRAQRRRRARPAG